MEGERGGWGGEVGGFLELVLQKWKKLGAMVSGKYKISKDAVDSLKVYSVVSLVNGSINVLVGEKLEN